METIVETWLDNNPTWFKDYALRKLDIHTVESWLELNKKSICRCKSKHQSPPRQCLDKKNPEKENLEKSVTFNPTIKKYTIKFSKSNNEANPVTNSQLTPSTRSSMTRSRSINSCDTVDKSNLSLEKYLNSSKKDLDNKFKAPNFDIDKLQSPNIEQSNKPHGIQLCFNDKNIEILNSSNRLKSHESPSTPASNHLIYTSNEPNNMISLNMVKRSNLIAMRKYNTMISTNSQSIDKILENSKQKLSKDIENHHLVNPQKQLLANKKHDPEFLVEIIKDISSESDIKILSRKIVNNLELIVDADELTLYLVARNGQISSPQTNETNPTIFSYVTDKSSNSETMKVIVEMNYFIKRVIETGELLNIEDVQKECENNPEMDKINANTKSILCIPIKNYVGQVLGVVQFAINKESKKSGFNNVDIKLLDKYFPTCGASIAHAQLFDLYVQEFDRNRTLLEVVHDLFQQQTNLDTILFRIMQKAQILLKCRRCSVLLILDKDDEILDRADSRKAFDLVQNGNVDKGRRQSEVDDGTKISKNLADYVIRTGNTINLSNAYSDPRFDPIVDTVWKFKTQAILCMPIRNLEGSIIGCAQIANRLDQYAFDENDELLFEAFCIFCGLGINNTLTYNKLETSMAEKSVALEVISYHGTCSKGELDAFLGKYQEVCFNKKFRIENLDSYVFDDFSLNCDEMILASYDMFKKLGFMKTFQIDRKTLFLWLLTVRKNYRDVEYHNWSHAFNVCQSMYSVFQNSKISSYLQDIEKLILLVGCLCHDLDHRGTNNMFQAESRSPLAQLYGISGTLEKHHFNHCIMILNTPGHNIFSQLKPKTYALVITYIKEAILATDLAEHFTIRKQFDELTRNKDTDWNAEENCSLLRKNLMTACDLNAVTKPWNIHQNLVRLVTNEFFAQGDRERFELHIEPQEIMDIRRSHNMPKLQIGWIENVCMPLYKNISHVCDSFKGHLMRIEENRTNWILIQKRLSRTLNLV